MSDADRETLANTLFRDWLRALPARTLSVGPGSLHLAHCLQVLGCEAQGVDNADLREQTGKFALVTMIQALERGPDPLDALRMLRGLVADDGVLFVRLPDHGVVGCQAVDPIVYSLSSFLELLVQGRDLFAVRHTRVWEGTGQRDWVLSPLVRKPTSYAGLIVKNEERDLPRCLRSIEDVVDGIVLVDTGSTDATLEVARGSTELPIHIQTYTEASRLDASGDWKIWDFSRARNVFVREIEERGADYVLWIDADDELLTPKQLRRVLYWDQYDVFGVQVESAGSRWVHHRVWKTRCGIHFEGRCHEYPTYGGHPSHILTDVVVRHHSEPGAGEGSNARNTRILREEFAESPSPRTAFYLANTYRDAGRYVEALPWYDQRIALGVGYPDEWLFAHLYKSRCQRWTGDLDGAWATSRAALSAAPGWSEFWMELAYCAYDQHDYRDAIRQASAARDRPQPPTMLWREPDKYTDQPPRLISWCHEHLGEAEEAILWALRARDQIEGRDDEWEDRIDRLRRGELYEKEVRVWGNRVGDPVVGGAVVEGVVGGPVAGDAVAGDAVAGDAVAGDAVAGDAVAGDAVAILEVKSYEDPQF